MSRRLQKTSAETCPHIISSTTKLNKKSQYYKILFQAFRKDGQY